MTKAGKAGSRYQILWACMLFLMGVGILCLPIHIRDPLSQKVLGGGFSRVNWILTIVTVILLLTKRDYEKWELWFVILWILLWIPVILSNRAYSLARTVPALCNCCMPALLLVQRIDSEKREVYLRRALIVFDCFIVILLIVAIHERLTGEGWLKAFVSWMKVHGYKCTEFKRYLKLYKNGDHRFFSFWGHTLTNAVYFNAFFILNDIYYRSVRKRYPKLLFFLITLAGVLSCVSKTAIVVAILYFVISNGPKKKWVALYVLGGGLLYALGAFDRVLYRFTHSSLTTGRVQALKRYFSQPKKPLRFLLGYGTGTTYSKAIRSMKAGFEFPPLMFALDYGILFSLLFEGSMFVYYSCEFIKRREWVSWMGISLLFAEINTYNGISLRNQDCGWVCAIILMLAINCVTLVDQRKGRELPEISGGRWKKLLIQILCGE